jgi:type VI secretion system Hcp family effector
MGFNAYFSVKGQKQGQFKGESTQHNDGDKWSEVLAFQMGVKSPYNSGTGQPSGKRPHKPITITKEWGAASPQIWQALCTNEVLQSVEFHFTTGSGQGNEVVHQIVTLTNAQIAGHEHYMGPIPPGSSPGHGYENVTFQYEGQTVIGGGGPASLVGPLKRFGKWG